LVWFCGIFFLLLSSSSSFFSAEPDVHYDLSTVVRLLTASCLIFNLPFDAASLRVGPSSADRRVLSVGGKDSGYVSRESHAIFFSLLFLSIIWCCWVFWGGVVFRMLPYLRFLGEEIDVFA
jgi:hypothetical protein